MSGGLRCPVMAVDNIANASIIGRAKPALRLALRQFWRGASELAGR